MLLLTLRALINFLENSREAQQLTNFVDASIGLFWTMFGYGSPWDWYPISNCPEYYMLQEVVCKAWPSLMFVFACNHIAMFKKQTYEFKFCIRFRPMDRNYAVIYSSYVLYLHIINVLVMYIS